ncbi:helix-turn-helix domain-containing protein [Burkholderia pseudomallei]|uniref:helix-turn-helix domain-containing protein n=1 Tax=Burkholderia pseudomallei TaxID=28450 RepID=UPI000F07DB2A|nr:helix-turn-helix transcriptional regulator [Burkholderia pseudomallei]
MDEQQKAALVKAVGQAIASRRVAAGLSQERVAEALGITREAVSRMETGVAAPSVVRLAELADIFSCSMADLVTEASNRGMDQAVRIAEMIGGLTTERRAVLLSVVQQVIDSWARGN